VGGSPSNLIDLFFGRPATTCKAMNKRTKSEQPKLTHSNVSSRRERRTIHSSKSILGRVMGPPPLFSIKDQTLTVLEDRLQISNKLSKENKTVSNRTRLLTASGATPIGSTAVLPMKKQTTTGLTIEEN